MRCVSCPELERKLGRWQAVSVVSLLGCFALAGVAANQGRALSVLEDRAEALADEVKQLRALAIEETAALREAVEAKFLGPLDEPEPPPPPLILDRPVYVTTKRPGK